MLATEWCAHPLGQPEIFTRSGRANSEYFANPLLKALLMALPKPFADAIPSRQVSDPGQVVTSVIVPAPRSASEISPSAKYRAQRSSSLTQVRDIFSSIEILTQLNET